ncbi:lysylphosphatidylglycerol synthase transmembrane domain-containing protein [Alphaproteobacteria bacterium]|nr:lysylphosphatidylglycerol synthase transmembrane domain-containing protein [Alphaproteobacteria bacterium]
MKAWHIGLVVFKVSVTVGLFGYLIGNIDLESFTLQLRSIQPLWAAAAISTLLAQLLLTGIRWYLVGHLVDAQLVLPQALRLALIGQFFNQLLPSSVGGDAVRVWIASREGISLGRAASSVFCDRTAGVVFVVLFVSLSLLLLPTVWQPGILAAGGFVNYLAVFITVGLLVLLLLGVKISKLMMEFRLSRPFGVLIRDMRIVLFTNIKSLQIVGLTAVVQVLVVTAAYFLAKGINVDLGFIDGLVLIPMIMLVSMMPVSFAG